MPDPMTLDLDAIREVAAFVRGGYDEEMASRPDRWYCNVSADAVGRLLDGTAALMAWGEHLAAEVERLRAELETEKASHAQTCISFEGYVEDLTEVRSELTAVRIDRDDWRERAHRMRAAALGGGDGGE